MCQIKLSTFILLQIEISIQATTKEKIGYAYAGKLATGDLFLQKISCVSIGDHIKFACHTRDVSISDFGHIIVGYLMPLISKTRQNHVAKSK